MRAGKRLARRETTIAIQFQRAPHPPFSEIAGDGLRPNVLLIHVQPDEGVSLAIGAKVPGAGMSIRTVHMDFLYGGAFRTGLPEAYERLILDAMLGDATLFTREDEVEEQWKLVDAIVGGWQRDRPSFPNYAAGTLGPAGGGRAAPSRRPFLEAALRGRRRGRARALPAPLPRVGRPAPGPADEHDDAPRLGARALAAEGPRGARGARGAPSGAHDHPRSRAGETAAQVDARVRLREANVEGSEREVFAEVIELRLRGTAARHPGSVVLPLLVPDLPVFCRWRGEPPWGATPLEEIAEVCDRLVVDSGEWPRLPAAYARLARALRPDRDLGHRLRTHAAVAGSAGRALARRRAGRAAPRRGPAGGGAPARRMAPVAAASATSR